MSYEEVIAEVQKHPLLYDKKHQFYRNKIKKQRSWLAISKAVGEDIERCQGHWRVLRDRFVREVRNPGSTWTFLQEMMFLKNHVGSRAHVQYRAAKKPTKEDAKQQNGTTIEATGESKNCKYEEDLSFLDYADEFETNDATELLADSVASCDHKRLDDTDLSFEEVQIQSSCTQTTFEDSAPSTQEEEETASASATPATTKAVTTATKRRRRHRLRDDCNSGAEQHFVSFVDSVKHMIQSKFDANPQQQHQPQRTTSRNEDFLRVLDGYMLKLDEEQQDAIKIEVLNLVYKRSIEMNSIASKK